MNKNLFELDIMQLVAVEGTPRSYTKWKTLIGRREQELGKKVDGLQQTYFL